MKLDALERYLNSFGKQVVNRAKGNLQKAKGGGTALENSIVFSLIEKGEDLTVRFTMASYGKFIDKGVSGTEVTRSFKDYKGETLKSPFGYRKAKGHSQPPTKALDKWIVKKGIAPRDKEGKFMSRKSIKFLIARSIGKKGIQGLSFFQKPLMLGMKQFAPKFGAAIKEDIIKSLK
jgi:hypothetical protein|tara:strand:+ start:231 stop:758 length:528 start_codon:yes stop_codon:yes gene_type:complete